MPAHKYNNTQANTQIHPYICRKSNSSSDMAGFLVSYELTQKQKQQKFNQQCCQVVWLSHVAFMYGCVSVCVWERTGCGASVATWQIVLYSLSDWRLYGCRYGAKGRKGVVMRVRGGLCSCLLSFYRRQLAVAATLGPGHFSPTPPQPHTNAPLSRSVCCSNYYFIITFFRWFVAIVVCVCVCASTILNAFVVIASCSCFAFGSATEAEAEAAAAATAWCSPDLP